MGGRVIDITGQRFASLVALKSHKLIPKAGMTWSCICDCGKTVIVLGERLRSGPRNYQGR
jgi:RNase P/RNase MRP subunit p29